MKPKPPPALPGFERINRYWDPHMQRFAAKILPGEYYVSAGAEYITTVLGSCVSACIRDPIAGVGGMNHFMLPKRAIRSDQPQAGAELLSDAFRYGNFAMEHLINDILKQGGQRDRLEFKVFGGGRILRGMTDVGEKNIAFVRQYLQIEGFKIAASDLGGNYPRKLVYFPDAGLVRMKRLDSLHNDTIIHREERYIADLDKAPVVSDVELFD